MSSEKVVESDYCINVCYYMDTDEECELDNQGIPKCKRDEMKRAESDYDKILCELAKKYSFEQSGYEMLIQFGKELDRIRNEEGEKEREELRAQIEYNITRLEQRKATLETKSYVHESDAMTLADEIKSLTWVLSLPYFASKKKAEVID